MRSCTLIISFSFGCCWFFIVLVFFNIKFPMRTGEARATCSGASSGTHLGVGPGGLTRSGCLQLFVWIVWKLHIWYLFSWLVCMVLWGRNIIAFHAFPIGPLQTDGRRYKPYVLMFSNHSWLGEINTVFFQQLAICMYSYFLDQFILSAGQIQ